MRASNKMGRSPPRQSPRLTVFTVKLQLCRCRMDTSMASSRTISVGSVGWVP